MVSQNRSISNNERPHKAIDYAIPSRKEAAIYAKEKTRIACAKVEGSDSSAFKRFIRIFADSD